MTNPFDFVASMWRGAPAMIDITRCSWRIFGRICFSTLASVCGLTDRTTRSAFSTASRLSVVTWMP